MSKSISLEVTGMKCGGCENNVTNKLQAVDGVINVLAQHKENKIDIEFEPEKTSIEAIIKVIAEAGYNVI